jgi:hypothetical protein
VQKIFYSKFASKIGVLTQITTRSTRFAPFLAQIFTQHLFLHKRRDDFIKKRFEVVYLQQISKNSRLLPNCIEKQHNNQS